MVRETALWIPRWTVRKYDRRASGGRGGGRGKPTDHRWSKHHSSRRSPGHHHAVQRR